MEVINIENIFPPRVQLKKHSKNQIEELCNSIKSLGQYKPLLIQKSSSRIICGYGVYLALKKLKIREVRVNKIDISDEEADNIRFTDNYSNESSEWNEDKLQYLFMEMSDELIKVSGFNNEEIENIFNDSIELLNRGDEIENKLTEKIKKDSSNEIKEEASENEIEEKEDMIEEEKKEDIKTDVEFVKIRYCGCCGKYYDLEGNEVELLR
jgi:ParB-like chromosome segregation protein Spo0J